MPVYANSGPSLGDALVGGAQGFMQNLIAAQERKRLRQQDDEARADRDTQRTLQRADLAQRGIHVLAPGELAPLSVMQDAGNNVRLPDIQPPTIDFNAPKPGAAPGQQSRAAAGVANLPGRAQQQQTGGDSTFRDLMASMGGGQAPSRGPRYDFGKGFYIDHQPEWDAQSLARSQKMEDQFLPLMVQRFTQQQERDRKVGQYVAAGVPRERAELYVDNPSLAENDPRYGKPHTDPLTERTPEKFMLGGQPMQGFTDKGGNFYDASGKKVTGQIAPYVAPPSPETKALRDIALGDRRSNQQNQTKDKILDDFARDTKKFDDVAAGWEVMSGALKNPGLATPFALADAYARIANPGAVVRPTTMQMIEDLGSLDQRVRKFISHNVNGQLPPDVTRDLVKTITGMVQEHKHTFDATRQQALLRAKQAGINDLDPILRNFEFADPFEEKPKTPPVGGGDTALPAHVQSIDEMIKAGLTDAQIKKALTKKVP